MRIALGSDHAGYALKQEVSLFLAQQGHDVKDCGVFSEASADYPDLAAAVVTALQEEPCSFGILICGTGVGMSIAANKRKGVRAALCGDPYTAQCARGHNNANVLAMGSRVIGIGLALAVVDAFIRSPFEEGRHALRVDKISSLE